MAGESFDVLVIGAGPGGYVAAIRAARLGLRAAVVERAHLGGICLNWGCIPTKALLRSAEVYRHMQRAEEYGIHVSGVNADLSAIVSRSRKVSGTLESGVQGLLRKNKVSVIWGHAKIVGPQCVRVSNSGSMARGRQPQVPQGALGEGDYQAEHIIIATGAKPRVLAGLEADGDRIWSYFEAMTPKRLPTSLLIVGSGAIGVEFASFYSSLGVQVTIVESLSRIVPVEDEEISEIVRKGLVNEGVKIFLDSTVHEVRKNPGGDVVVQISASGGDILEISVDCIISAVGVAGNIENLGLEDQGVEIVKGCVKTDGYGRTNVAGIYAIGDVAGPPMLAHKAEHEGIVCVEKIAGMDDVHPVDRSRIPGCTYCFPQIASVGLTEKAARDAGYDLKIGRFPFMANGKAIALGESEGLVKTLFDARTGRLLGAHLVGAEVTELIQGFVIAMNLETTEEDLIHTVFPHPTLSEMMHESVMDAYGRAIHK